MSVKQQPWCRNADISRPVSRLVGVQALGGRKSSLVWATLDLSAQVYSKLTNPSNIFADFYEQIKYCLFMRPCDWFETSRKARLGKWASSLASLFKMLSSQYLHPWQSTSSTKKKKTWRKSCRTVELFSSNATNHPLVISCLMTVGFKLGLV